MKKNSSLELKGVNFIIIRSDEKILIQKRCLNAHSCPGMYCFPGGAIDEGETAKEAIIREIEEETFLRVVPEDLQFLTNFEYFFKGKPRMNSFYFCRIYDKEITSREGEMIWMTFFEICNLKLALGENVILMKLLSLLEEEMWV